MARYDPYLSPDYEAPAAERHAYELPYPESPLPPPKPKPEAPAPKPKKPWESWTREQWRDAWMGLGALTPEEADAWLREHGATPVNPSSGVWQTPHGEVLDLQIGRKAAVASGGRIQPGWGGIGGGGGSGGGAPTGLPAGTVPAALPAGTVPAAPFDLNALAGAFRTLAGTVKDTLGAYQEDPRTQRLLELLLTRATQPLDLSASDPRIRAQVEPMSAEFERQRRQAETEAAERLAAQGLAGSGQLDVTRRMLEERAGQQIGQLQAQVLGRELEARRGEIQQALQLGAGLLSDIERTRLQRELAGIEAASRLLGPAVERELGLGRLGVERELGLGRLGLERELGLGQLGLGQARLGYEIGRYEDERLARLLGLA